MTSYEEIFYLKWRDYGYGGSPDPVTGQDETRSGPGSSLEQTKTIRDGLETLFREKNIETVLDIPCGDFNWFKKIVFNLKHYIGGDIVKDAISENNKLYSNSIIEFREMDVLIDELPSVDLIIVRDLLGHYPIEEGHKIITNILNSNSKYVLFTTWYHLTDPKYHRSHRNKEVNYGDWYPINLMSDPFNFPAPIGIVEENFHVDGYNNGVRKILGLWNIADLRKHVLEKNITVQTATTKDAVGGNIDITSLLTKIYNFPMKKIGGGFDPALISGPQTEKLVQQLLITIDENIPGDVVELGCYIGETSKFLMLTLLETDSTKKLYVYDSFEGLPKVSSWEQNSSFLPGSFSNTSKDILEANFTDNHLPVPFIHKDWFKDIPPQSLPESICFAFLDGDFYDSIRDSLEKVFDRVVEGGYIIFHDYNRPDLLGVKAAVDDFLKSRKLENTTIEICEQLGMYRKLPGAVKPTKGIPKYTKDVTIVTGLWNIGREGRDFSHYIEQFNKFLDIPVNMFIYLPKELEYLVWEKRSPINTYVKVFELEQLKNFSPDFYEKIQKLRTDPEWYNITGEGGWLKNSPQAMNEWYNPIVMNKMPMLHDASIFNVFDSKYFIWLDAAITNTVYEKYLTDENIFEKIIPHIDPFLFLCYPYNNGDEVHGFKRSKLDELAGENVLRVARGGLFGGTKESIRTANGLYYSLMEHSLHSGYMGTEEYLFSVMTYLNPETYRIYMLDDNGLIVKYIQNLINGTAELEPIPDERVQFIPIKTQLNDIKTDKYILTFNFPEQLQAILDNFKEVGWDRTRATYVIDNSSDSDIIFQNKLLCDAYGAIHFPQKENTGINGGRYFAADHFNHTDADFYFFFEDDMMFTTADKHGFMCRNGFQVYYPNLYEKVHGIMLKEKFDFLKLSYTEVYMDNNIQVSWYNVPQTIRTKFWPKYDKLPINGLDSNCPRTQFNKIEVYDGLSYISGEIYYCNWPMIMNKEGNRKVFLETTWARPYEQTWMSHVFQETKEGHINPAVLLASPINHNRISHYTPEERREN